MANTGPVRSYNEMYNLHCRGEFAYLRSGMDALNKKVFNGLSDLPKRMQRVERLLISLLVSLALLFGSVMITSVISQARTEALLREHTEIGE